MIVFHSPIPLKIPTVTTSANSKKGKLSKKKHGVPKAKRANVKKKGGKGKKGKKKTKKAKGGQRKGQKKVNKVGCIKKKKPMKKKKSKKSKISPIISKGRGFGMPSTFKELK